MQRDLDYIINIVLPVHGGKYEDDNVDPWKHQQWFNFLVPDFLKLRFYRKCINTSWTYGIHSEDSYLLSFNGWVKCSLKLSHLICNWKPDLLTSQSCHQD